MSTRMKIWNETSKEKRRQNDRLIRLGEREDLSRGEREHVMMEMVGPTAGQHCWADEKSPDQMVHSNGRRAKRHWTAFVMWCVPLVSLFNLPTMERVVPSNPRRRRERKSNNGWMLAMIPTGIPLSNTRSDGFAPWPMFVLVLYSTELFVFVGSGVISIGSFFSSSSFLHPSASL